MGSRWRWACLAGVLAVTSLVACSASEPAAAPEVETTAAAPSSSSTAVSTTTTTILLPEPVPVGWTSCGGGFQCASMAVPVDYAAPSSGTLEIALIRRPASDPGRRIGTLVMNPGGPGASGVRRVRRGFSVSSEVAARFDIVGFDPRGVGESTPVSCGATVPAFRATDLSPDDPDEQAALEAAARAVAEECRHTEGARLAHLGTAEVVHDLEVLRRNLGEPQISFVGLSYGTLIGLLWADAYPGSVRAMVLDGVEDPGSGGSAISTGQVRAVERLVEASDQACAADPTCPLTQRGQRLLAAYDALAARVEAGDELSAGVGPTQLAYAALASTYGTERWPDFWRAVAQGDEGDGRELAAQAAWFTGLVAYGPFAIVTCLDGYHPQGFDAWRREADQAAAASPRFGAVLANELLPCALWPSSSRRQEPVVAVGAPPVLVVGTTGDAATPYEQAAAVARTLARGSMLTVDDDGHVAIGSSECVDSAVTRYLVDLTVPDEGARC